MKNFYSLPLFLFAILITLSFAVPAFAESYPGYLNSMYGGVIQGSYGQCVHTSYFDPKDGIAACGEALPQPKVESKPTIVLETVTISDADTVLFNFNVASLTTQGVIALTNFINKIDHEPDVTKITINGYTDAMGKYAYNMQLATNRAQAVAQFFVTKGYPQNRIVALGLGPQNAKASAECFAKYGLDPLNQMWIIQSQLESTKFNRQKLPKQLAKQKKALQTKLSMLQAKRDLLIQCTAPDRRVVFTIEHTKQVQKLQSSSAPIKNVASAITP